MRAGREAPPPGWQVWLGAARPRTLPAAVAPVLVGSALAAHDQHFQGAAAALCLIFALLVQIGTNFANDYYDFLHGADTALRVGPRRAVAAGLVSPPVMRRAMLGVFAAAFAIGLSLLHWGGPWMLVVGVASILSGLAYTGGPYPLGYHGLGDVFVFLFFGLVAVSTTYFVQAGRVSGHALLAGVPIGLMAANILVVNNYRDFETDREARKRTLVVRWGRRFARGQFALALVGAFTVPALFLATGYPGWILLPLGAVPMAIVHTRRLARADQPTELVSLLGATGQLLTLYAVLFAVGILA